MRKASILALVAAFILSTVAMAGAVEMKASGNFRVHANWTDNLDFQKTDQDGKSEDDFTVWQRARIYFQFIANENVKAVFKFEMGDSMWGEPGKGADLGADDKVIELKNAYLQFNLPDTDVVVKAGVQGVALPNNFGSAILDDDAAALVVSAPVSDMAGITLGWVRAKDLQQVDPTENTVDDEADVLFAVIPVKGDGFKVSPFFAYEFIGKDVIGDTDDASAWWFGLSGKITAMDPIAILFDLNYGSLDAKTDAMDQAGWFGGLAVDYKMDMMTPEVFFLYSSGNDDDASNGGETIPAISPDITYTPFGLDGSSFTKTGGILTTSATGFWALGLKLKGMSFAQNLSHDFVLMYAQGTNAKENVNEFTTKDNFVEVDFNTKYKMYENLCAIVEMGYAKMNLSDDELAGRDDWAKEPAWKLAVGLKYKF